MPTHALRRRIPLRVLAIALAMLVCAAVALASTGALTPKGCIADPDNNPEGCAQTAKGLDGATSVDVSPDGKSAYVAGFFDNAIVRFNRKPATGALSPAGCVAEANNNPDGCAQTAAGLKGANSVVVSDDGKSVYAIGSGDNAIVRFKRDTTTGALTPKGCIGDLGNNPAGCPQTAKGLRTATSVAVSSDGKSVYVASYLPNAIARFDRNTTTGALTPQDCVAELNHNPEGCTQTAQGLSGTSSVAVSDDGISVYATGVTVGGTIARFVRSATGALTPRGCIADPAHNDDGCGQTAKGLSGAESVDVSSDGKSVYVGGVHDYAIVRFDRATDTGALIPKGCISSAGNNPAGCAMTAKGVDGASVTVSPDGASVYTTGQDATSAIARFDRDTLTGALTKKGCIADPANNPEGCGQTTKGLDGPQAAAVSDDGKSVYVTSIGDVDIDPALVRFDRTP
jgi:sugar lactone lactonase YvrE